MSNITVTRYPDPAAVGWQGWMEPDDRSWIAFVGSDGKRLYSWTAIRKPER